MQYKYCPACGKPYGNSSSTAKNFWKCEFCDFVLYNNPKPAVIALIKDKKGRILLTKRGIEPFLGYWGLPGGFIMYGEDPREALKRELKEELNVSAVIGRPVDAYHEFYENKGRKSEKYSLLILVLETEISEEEKIVPSDDVSEAIFFYPNDFPENIAFSGLRDFLDRYKKEMTSCS